MRPQHDLSGLVLGFFQGYEGLRRAACAAAWLAFTSAHVGDLQHVACAA